MINLLDKTTLELEELLLSMKQPKFRAKQIMQGITRGLAIADITNLPQTLKNFLSEEYSHNTVSIHSCLVSRKDGTRKYIFSLGDGNIIEGVLMCYNYGNTICVSTQVGCRMNCAFCASGLKGLVRNLTAGEILGQVIAVNADIAEKGERCITNIVLMGSGEPLDNYDNVVRFLRLVSSPDGMGVSPRNISLSTCGMVSKIMDLAELNIPITLTISLHAPTDEIRSSIMPINNKWKIAELMDAVRYYFNKSGRRIIFEYSMISGVNDSILCANTLARLIKGLPCHVNIINLNAVKENDLRSSRKEVVADFISTLEQNKVSVTLRRTVGSDIEGACGQLRQSILDGGINNG